MAGARRHGRLYMVLRHYLRQLASAFRRCHLLRQLLVNLDIPDRVVVLGHHFLQLVRRSVGAAVEGRNLG